MRTDSTMPGAPARLESMQVNRCMGALDTTHQKAVLEKGMWAKEGRTMVMVTHKASVMRMRGQSCSSWRSVFEGAAELVICNHDCVLVDGGELVKLFSMASAYFRPSSSDS